MRITSVERLPDGSIHLRGLGIPNRGHTLEHSSTLLPASFEILATIAADADGRWEIQDPFTLGGRFYRVGFP